MKQIIFIILIFTSTKVVGNYSTFNQQNFKWEYSTNTLKSIDSTIKNKDWRELISKNLIFKAEKNKYIWIRTKINSKNSFENALYIDRNAKYYEIYINNKKVYELNNANDWIRQSNSWYPNIINLPPLYVGDIVFIKFSNYTGKNFLLPQITIGKPKEIIKIIFIKSIAGLIISAFVFVLAIISLLIFIFLERKKIIFGLFIFLLSIGVFIALNTTMYQIALNSWVTYFYLDKISLQLTGITFFFLLSIVVDKKLNKIIDYIWKVKGIIFIVSLLIILFWQTYIYDTLKLVLFLNMIFLIIGIIVVSLSYKIGKKQSKIILCGMLLIMSTVLIQTVLNFINLEIRLNTNILNIGTLLFSSSIIWFAISHYLEAKKETERMKEIEFISLKRENEERSLFAAKLIESQENERNRIALELHDSIGQKLILIKNLALSKIKSNESIDEKTLIHKINDLSDETITEIRNITYNLRPLYLDQLGLSVAIETMTEKICELSEINIIHEVDDKINKIIPKNDYINFFRIIQECLNNIVKHSQADQVFLKVVAENDFITLEIRDNGTGFQISEQKYGTGLTSVSERAKMLNSHLEISSNENGTKIKMNYPITNCKSVNE